MAKRPNADGSPRGSVTGEKHGGSDYGLLFDSSHRESCYSCQPQSSNTPCGSHLWAQYVTQQHGTHSAWWGQRPWVPRGQPWQSQPGGGGDHPNAKRHNTQCPHSTGRGNSRLCYPCRSPTEGPYCARRPTWKSGQWQSWVFRPGRERSGTHTNRRVRLQRRHRRQDVGACCTN